MWTNCLCRVYGFMLGAYPEAFRNRFGSEMQQVFRDGCRAAVRNNDLLGFVLRTSWDWLGTLFRERLAALRGRDLPEAPPSIATRWLLAVCGLLNAIYAAMNCLTPNRDGSFALRTAVNSRDTMQNMGLVALAAGICMIAAGMCSARHRGSWLVVLNGLASSALGLILFWGAFGYPIAFRTIALLIVVMALSLGAFGLRTARRPRLNHTDKLLLSSAGVVSVAFALAFLSFALNWIVLHARPQSDFLCFGSYFGFAGLSMLGLAARLHGTCGQPVV